MKILKTSRSANSIQIRSIDMVNGKLYHLKHE